MTGPYTVDKALDEYLNFLREDGRADLAIKDANYRIDAFIRPALGKFEVAALKPEQLRHWRADMAKANHACAPTRKRRNSIARRKTSAPARQLPTEF